MSNMLVGVEGIARKVKAMYIGVDGIARKVKKGYVGVDGVARCFYSGDHIVYTGTHTVSSVIDTSGKTRTLYTLTGSGTLTLGQDTEYWMCGGGGCGARADDTDGYYTGGGGGGGGYVTSGNLQSGEYIITIGAGAAYRAVSNGSTPKERASSTVISSADSTLYEAGGGYLANSTYASASYLGRGANGGSGGGAGGAIKDVSGISFQKGTPGTGDKTNTIPFGIETLYAHSAGGGGGSFYTVEATSPRFGVGGDGGSNGSNGNNAGWDYEATDSRAGGSGGVRGGGKGGTASASGNGTDGSAATFYGSGGGGGAYSLYGTGPYVNWKKGGAGYQGVVYLLI